MLRRVVDVKENLDPRYRAVPLNTELTVVKNLANDLAKRGTHMVLKYRNHDTRGANIVVDCDHAEELAKITEECDVQRAWQLIKPSTFSLKRHMAKFLKSKTGITIEDIVSGNT